MLHFLSLNPILK